jgi:hypothetical protein
MYKELTRCPGRTLRFRIRPESQERAAVVGGASARPPKQPPASRPAGCCCRRAPQRRAPDDPVLLHSVNLRSPPESCCGVPQHATGGANPGDRFDLGLRLTARHRMGDRAGAGGRRCRHVKSRVSGSGELRPRALAGHGKEQPAVHARCSRKTRNPMGRAREVRYLLVRPSSCQVGSRSPPPTRVREPYGEDRCSVRAADGPGGV